MTQEQAVKLWKNGKTMMTITWNYSTASWSMGQELVVVKGASGHEYLRTKKDGKHTNNLDNLINMSAYS